MALPTKRTIASRMPGILSSEASRYGFGVDPDTASFNENMRGATDALREVATIDAQADKKRRQACRDAHEGIREARLAVRRHRDDDVRSLAARELAAVRRQVAKACPRGKR
jgi:hypothetical protein